MADTLKCSFSPDETLEIRRTRQVKTLKMGLMRYVTKTPLAQFMDINFSQPMAETVTSDKWNSWVYSASMYASSNGQKSYNYSYVDGTLSANRITEKSKFESSISFDLQTSKNVYSDSVYKSTIREKYVYLRYVKSINDHWSAEARQIYRHRHTVTMTCL
jgi:hypothetical protein